MPLTNNAIALQLVFKNPNAIDEFDKHAFEQQKFTVGELYGEGECEGNVYMDCWLLDKHLVKILYQDGMLVVKTKAKIDILLSGNTPAIGIHIETGGGCGIVDGSAMNLAMGLYIKADGIVVNLPIVGNDLITLISKNNPTSMIHINSPIESDKLKLETCNLLQNANITANAGGIYCKAFKCEKGCILSLGGEIIEPRKSTDKKDDIFLPETCNTWRQRIIRDVFRNKKSIIVADEVICNGVFNINKASINVKNKLHFLPDSSGELIKLEVFAGDVQIDKKASLTGADTVFQVKNQFDIDGKCNINRLVVSSQNLTACGLLWGDESLDLVISDFLTSNGIVGSNETKVKAGYVFACAVQANEAIHHEFFVAGSIVGKKNLSVDALSTMLLAGGYFYGHNVNVSGGLYTNIFGAIIAYNCVNTAIYKNGLYGLVVPFTTKISEISIPKNLQEMKDMAVNNSTSLLRLAEYMGTKVPIIRAAITAVNLLIASKPAIDSIANDPHLFRQLCNAVNFTQKTCGSAIESATDGLSLLHYTIMNEWDPIRVKKLVDVLLKAQGVFIYGYMLKSQITNAVVYSISDLQNHIIYNPNLTFENIRNYSPSFNASWCVSTARGVAHDVGLYMAPSVYETSFMENNSGWTITGTSTRYTGWYSAVGGGTKSLASSVHSATNIHNHGHKINSLQHSETAINRYHHGETSVNNLTLLVSNNYEDGKTKAKESLTLNAVNCTITKKGNLESKGQTHAVVTGNFQSLGGTDLRSGTLQVDNNVIYEETSSATADKLDMKYNGDLTRKGRENFTDSSILTSGNNESTATGRFTHKNVHEYVHGGSKDSATLNKINGTRTIHGSATYAEESRVNAENAHFDYQNGLQQEGKETATGGSINIVGNENYTKTSTTNHDGVQESTTGDFNSDGAWHATNLKKWVGGKTTFAGKSTVIKGSSLKFTTLENKSAIVLDDKSSLTADYLKNKGNLESENGSLTDIKFTENAPGAEFKSTDGRHVGEIKNFGHVTIKGSKTQKNIGSEQVSSFTASADMTEGLETMSGGVTDIYGVYLEIGKNVANPGSHFAADESIYNGEETNFLQDANIDFARSHINVDRIIDDGATVSNTNTLIQSKSISRKGKWHINGFSQIETDHIQSSPDSSLSGESLGLHAKTEDCRGAENLKFAVKRIDEMPVAEARDMMLGVGKFANKSAEIIWVETQNKDPIGFAGPRQDGAYAILITGGATILPVTFDRAKGATFSTYAEAVEFVENKYATHNLPPPQKKKQSIAKKVGKAIEKGVKKTRDVIAEPLAAVGSALVVAGASNPVFFVIGAAACGTAAWIDTSNKSHARDKNRKIEAAALNQANEQFKVDYRLLAANEQASFAEAYKEQHYNQVNEVIDGLYGAKNSVNVSDINASQTFVDRQAEIAGLYADHRLSLEKDHEQKAYDIKAWYNRDRQQISNSPGPKISAGGNINSGSTGISGGAYFSAGNQGQMGTGHVNVFNYDFPKSSTEQYRNDISTSSSQQYNLPHDSTFKEDTAWPTVSFKPSEFERGARGLSPGFKNVFTPVLPLATQRVDNFWSGGNMLRPNYAPSESSTFKEDAARQTISFKPNQHKLNFHESITPEKWQENYGVKLNKPNVLWLYMTNKLLPGDRDFVKRGILSSMSEAVKNGEENSFGLIRKVKKSIIDDYFNRGLRAHEKISSQHGISPNVTSMAYAAPGLTSAALSLIPDTHGQVALQVGIIVGAEPVAASSMWLFHCVKGQGVIKRLNPGAVKFSQSSYATKQLPLTHQFVNESELLKHFKKHSGGFKGAYQSPQDYLDGANFVINHGHKVKYQYMGQERIGYVRFMGNTRNLSVDEMLKNIIKRELGLAKDHKFGEAKFEFLALRNDGTIATYHTQSTENFCKTLNQNKNADTINVENLSCRIM